MVQESLAAKGHELGRTLGARPSTELEPLASFLEAKLQFRMGASN